MRWIVDFLDEYAVCNNEIVILGDFNLHYDCPNETYVGQINNIFNTRNLQQMVSKPTQRAGHILDWVVVRNQNICSEFQVIDKCISDHSVVSFLTCFDKPASKKRTILTRNIRTIDSNKFTSDLSTCNNIISQAHDKAIVYFNELSKLIDTHAPLRSRNVTNRPSAPWMTCELKSAKAERRRAERQWRKTGLPEHKYIFKLLISKVNSLIITSKRLFYQAKISESTSSKYLYSLVDYMYGKSKTSIFPNNISLCDLPDKFSNFFSTKISKIRENLDMACISRPVFNSFNGEGMTSFVEMSPCEVREIVLASPSKSCTLDPIPTKFIIANIDSVIECLTNIINDSLNNGIMPPSLKHALISPLLKKPNLDPNELKNYRPVSNLPFLSKLIEKAVVKQINSYLQNSSLLEINQSAYRKNHNTETALLKISNDLLMSADQKNVSIIALLDLSAAFDTIDHDFLINRLHSSFGFGGVVLNWFKSYLCDRTQSVVCSDFKSSSHPLSFGVPQGSVLGPILYTLYTTPLGDIIRKHSLNYHMYADDTQLYLSIEPSNVSDIVFSLENCIKDVKQWMLENKLQLNDEKTEILLINPKKYDIDVNNITIGNDCIAFSEHAKNLGVYISNDLSMKCHVTNLCKAIYLEIRRLKHMSTYVDENSLKTLAASFILSRFDYCNSLFKNINKDLLNKLQKLQNFAAKVILKKSIRDHVTPCLITLHWLPVQYRIDFKIAVLVYKCLNNLAPSYLSNLIELYSPQRTLRSSNSLLLSTNVGKFKTLGDRAFSVSAPTVWNALPLGIKRSPTLDIFKRDLKTHYFSMYYT